MLRLIIIFICLLISFCSFSQKETAKDIRLGVGFKLTAEYQNNHGLKFRMSAAAGVGNYVAIAKNDFGLLPTVHLGVLFYNKGILGSNLNPDYNRSVFFDFFADATVNAGFNNQKRKRLNNKFVPLYHFSDFTVNPLQNTLQFSLAFGSNWIMNADAKRNSQTVGFFNLNIARTVQVSYYNDGGPILNYLGDKEDRYYTGGVVLSAHFNRHAYMQLVALSFHKFTGWQPYAFDASDKLQLDHIPYKDKDVFGFNQQQWKLEFTNYSKNFSAYLTAYDVNKLDVQDALHFSRDNPYHPDYFWGYRLAAGIASENSLNTD